MDNKVWKCLNCTEEVEDQFDVCWNCEATRAGRLPATRISLQIPEDTEQKTFLNEKFRSKYCVRCNIQLTYAGRKEFHEGMKLGALGDFAELFVNQTKLEMYVCTNCFRVEFFLSNPR
jgi:hypothetical protein